MGEVMKVKVGAAKELGGCGPGREWTGAAAGMGGDRGGKAVAGPSPLKVPLFIGPPTGRLGERPNSCNLCFFCMMNPIPFPRTHNPCSSWMVSQTLPLIPCQLLQHMTPTQRKAVPIMVFPFTCPRCSFCFSITPVLLCIVFGV